ncbi:MAG: hypothetical protein R6U70_08920 [Bacillota bacterium]
MSGQCDHRRIVDSDIAGRDLLKRALGPVLWLALFAAVVVFLAWGYPLALAPQSSGAPEIAPVLSRPLTGPGLPLAIVTISPVSTTGEGLPVLVLQKRDDGSLLWEMEGSSGPVHLPGPASSEQLLTTCGDHAIVVAQFGGTDLVVLTVGDEGIVAESWAAPTGVVTGLYAHSQGLMCVTTAADSALYPDEFPADGHQPVPPDGALIADHLWFWDRGSWARQPFTMGDAVVLAHCPDQEGRFPSPDSVLVLQLSDLRAGGGSSPLQLRFLRDGEVSGEWLLSPGDEWTCAPHLALGADGAADPLALLWNGTQVAAYGAGGGEPRWVFSPHEGASGTAEVTNAFTAGAGAVVTSVETVHFLDKDGRVSGNVTPASPVVDAFPLPDSSVFVVMTEEAILMYDERAHRLWSGPVDCPPLAWDMFTVRDGDARTHYLSVATACELLQYRLDVPD